MTNPNCHTCRDYDCDYYGSDRVACENWTSDENGKQPHGPDPFAALEARIRGLDSELADVKARLAMFDRILAAVVHAQDDID